MNVYLNRTNVSVNTSMSLFKGNGTTYTAAVEKSVYGENVTEYNVDNSKWEVFGGVTYDKNTLKGERRFLIPDLLKKQTSLYIGVNYKF